VSDAERTSPERFSLKRWSARKLQAARGIDAVPVAKDVPPPAAAAPAGALPETPAQPAVADLPPIESLTPESDFSPFMNPEVPEALKRQALKKLFADPRFNVMDGLDVYIDDYSTPSPLEPALVSQLAHARFTLDPPPTRINARGEVEDIPPEELEAPAQLALQESTPALEPVTALPVDIARAADTPALSDGSPEAESR